jgi:hypothetical protein
MSGLYQANQEPCAPRVPWSRATFEVSLPVVPSGNRQSSSRICTQGITISGSAKAAGCAAAHVRGGRRQVVHFRHLGQNTFTLGRADYQWQYEPILYGWKEGANHYWCGARDQGDVWFIDKPVRNDLHPTMKPVALVERAIRNSSKNRDIVLDPFGDSGSTLIAREKAGRQARLVELDPRYVDKIILRWQEFSGGTATLNNDGRSFEEMASGREAAAA